MAIDEGEQEQEGGPGDGGDGGGAIALPAEAAPPRRENIWLNLGLNIIIPSLLMVKGKDWLPLDPKVLLVVALAFPVSYGIYDFIARKKTNLFSILGFVSILLTGGIGLLELPTQWVAVKEAAIPGLIGLAVLVSIKTRHPLINVFLYNPEIFNVPKIKGALERKGTGDEFAKLLMGCNYWLATSWLLAAVVNYIVAKVLVTSPAGTEAFVEELGRMTFWGFIVISFPLMIFTVAIIMKLFNGIHRLTGYDLEEFLLTAPGSSPGGDS